MTNKTEQMQNSQHACSINGIPNLAVKSLKPKAGKSSTNTTAPRKNPPTKVANDACAVPRRQNTPQRKTVVIGGAKQAIMALSPSKIPPNFSPWVDQRVANSM